VSEYDQALKNVLERMMNQEKEALEKTYDVRKEFQAQCNSQLLQQKVTRSSSTNSITTVSTPVNTSSTINTASASRTFIPPHDPLMLELEDTAEIQTTGIFGNAYDEDDLETNIHSYVDESVRAVADYNNMEPSTVITQALNDERWVEAMQEELLQFKIQKVWTLVDLPNGKKAIGTKWVYRNKKDKRGIVVRKKARLVAQGHTQEEGIDYDEVFSPVARVKAIRLFLAFASYMNFIMYQMDVKSAFLYGTIDEEVYVSQPLGFVDPKFLEKVHKVEKALYGLHQAPKAWYETLSIYLLDNRFHKGQIDKTLFIKRLKGDILLVQVYVDDIIFDSTKKSLCDEFEQIMHNIFQMSSMGELTFFLGLQVQQKEDGIFINQDKYVGEIQKKFSFFNIRSANTPMETHKPLTKDENGEDVNVHLYRSMIGSLMYLTSSRPDIMFLVCACSRFQESPLTLEAFSDSDYTVASLDRKSTIGGSFKCWLITTPQMVINSPCLTDKKELAIPGQTTTGKELSNPLMAGSLPKTTLPTKLLQTFKTLSNSLPTQTLIQFTHRSSKPITMSTPTFAKTHNLIAYLEKPTESEGFVQIIDFLNGSSVKYALTVNYKLMHNPYPSPLNHQLPNTRRNTNQRGSIPKNLRFILTESQAEHNIPLPSPSYDLLPSGEDSLKLKELIDLCTNLSNKVLDLKSEVLDIKSTYKAKIKKLENRVERLEKENRVLMELKGAHSTVDSDEPVMEKEESSKQGRKIADINADVEIDLEKSTDIEEVVEVVTTAKLITKVVTTTRDDVNAASVQDTLITVAEATKVTVEVPKPRKRRGVIIQDLEETTTTVTEQPKAQAKDKGKAILIEEPNLLKRQVSKRLTDVVMKYQALKRKPLTEAQARRNMTVYLKNMVGYKMNYFKGMSYDEIRPLFEKHYKYNQAFLNEVNEGIKVSEKEVRQEKEVEVESSKRECESLEQEITKKQKMEKETEELKKHLQIVPDDDDDDDDVYIDATPLASKIRIVQTKTKQA
nr:copia protein [Tanacetum cinerariifolium]